MYFDGQKMLTYNCLFNFIIGARSIGKTYWAKEWGIRDFLKTGNQFAYVRRYSTELKEGKKKDEFFKDIEGKFPEHEFSVKGMKGYIDGKVACHFFILSKAITNKSVSYPLINKVFYDEFILDSGMYHYIPDEPRHALDLYFTIARDRENVKMFFLANSVTITNPYFMYFNMRVSKNKEYQRFQDNLILVHIPKCSQFRDKMEHSRFGQLIKGTKYFDYAVENDFYKDNDIFIRKKDKHSKYSFTIKNNGYIYGVWWNYKDNTYYITSKIDPSCKVIFSLTICDHDSNTLLHKNSKMLRDLAKAFSHGQVGFENIQIKNSMIEILRRFL